LERITLSAADGVQLEAVFHPVQAGKPRGCAVMSHGITSSLEEDGLFPQLADRLSKLGLGAIRFSFRGHGKSGGKSEGMTIAGELLDLTAAIEYAQKAGPGAVSLVASSFGGVATSLSLPFWEPRLTSLLLWQPVLDIRGTFLEPTLPWGVKMFGPEAVKKMAGSGYMVVNEGFHLGWVAYQEMARHDAMGAFLKSRIPAFIIHGDADTYVAYEASKKAAAKRPNCELLTLKGADHGFGGQEETLLASSANWLSKQHR
jgi:alpha/beta superfamily hydrolase